MSDDDDYVPRPAVVSAMEHLFGFADAMIEGDITTAELRQVMSFAIEKGHDVMSVALTMAHVALTELQTNDHAGQ